MHHDDAAAHVRAGLAERLLHNKRSYKETLAPPAGVDDLLQKLQQHPPPHHRAPTIITTTLPPKRRYTKRRSSTPRDDDDNQLPKEEVKEKGILDISLLFCEAEEEEESPLAFLAEFDWASEQHPSDLFFFDVC
jgi:hypothetical protein